MGINTYPPISASGGFDLSNPLYNKVVDTTVSTSAGNTTTVLDISGKIGKITSFRIYLQSTLQNEEVTIKITKDGEVVSWSKMRNTNSVAEDVSFMVLGDLVGLDSSFKTHFPAESTPYSVLSKRYPITKIDGSLDQSVPSPYFIYNNNDLFWFSDSIKIEITNNGSVGKNVVARIGYISN